MALKSRVPALVPTLVKSLNTCSPTQFLSVNLMLVIEVPVVAVNVESIVASVTDVGAPLSIFTTPEVFDMYLT